MTCSRCGNEARVDRSASVNADLRPDLRAAILDGSFQSESCVKCGAPLRLPPHLTLLHLGGGQWIMVEPATMLEQWREAEAEARTIYDDMFGENAPPAARDIGKDLRARLVFGWPALREKLFARDLDLDDVVLELLKIAIIRTVAAPPMADQIELRLSGGDTWNLNFVWVDAETEAVLSQLTVPRVAYDDIARDADGWASLKARLDGVLLVDLRRMIAGPAA
jgi:hypothetical protein